MKLKMKLRMKLSTDLTNFNTWFEVAMATASRTTAFLAFIASLLLSNFALAQENVVIVKKNVREIFEDSSEANRVDKKITVTANLIGIGANYGPAPALGLGYFISRNDLLLAEIAGGKGLASRSYTSSNGIITKKGESEAKMSQIYLSYKHYTGNSFYYRVGGVYSDISYEYNEDTISDSSVSRFQAQVFSATGAIGNQWQWENFTLGCDWIGASAVIGSNIKSQSIEGTISASTVGSQQDDIDLYTKRSQLMALRFYLGASF